MALLKIMRKGEKKSPPTVDEPMPLLPKDTLGVSEAAALRIQALLADKPDEKYFRVAIRGGGCSGLSIHYEWARATKPNDVIFAAHGGVQVVIDQKSLSVLGGATLHCRSYLGSTEFMLVNNPAAKQCSCGQSFSL